MEQGGSFIVAFRPGQIVVVSIEGNSFGCDTVVCLSLSFLGFCVDAFATVTGLVALVDATVAAFAWVRRGRFREGLSFLMDGSECGLGFGGWSLLCGRVPPSAFALDRSGAFAFASISASFAFRCRTAAFAFVALISSLSFVAFKGDGVVRQGRVLVAQSAELKLRVLRETGKCV